MDNCKAGDKAIVAKAKYPENIGITVTVLRPARMTAHGAMWWVDTGEPRPGIWNGVHGMWQEFITQMLGCSRSRKQNRPESCAGCRWSRFRLSGHIPASVASTKRHRGYYNTSRHAGKEGEDGQTAYS